MIEVVSSNIKTVSEELTKFRDELIDEVCDAYDSTGKIYGEQTFSRWNKRFQNFVSLALPSEVSAYGALFSVSGVLPNRRYESDLQEFIHQKGERIIYFIECIISELEKERFVLISQKLGSESNSKESLEATRNVINETPLNKVFIVHGHDELEESRVARFIEKLGLEAIILHEQSSAGKTIIEKLEEYSDVGFGIILYTPDDHGNVKSSKELKPRARQNVVFEHGYMIAKLGRDKVCALVKRDIEKPNDISGVVYIELDRGNSWQLGLASELKRAGYDINMNKLL